MVIAIIGENCTGKSTLAEKIKETFGGETVTGKDYLRMAKSESEAAALFREKLKNAVDGENIIYVISEKEHLSFLPDGAIRILAFADIDTIKERFRERMRGVLPPPVENMLVSKHGMFDEIECDYRYDGAKKDTDSICRAIKEK